MADESLSLPSEDAPLAGVAFVVTGLTIFSLQDVIIKGLSDGYPAHQIVFLRGLVGLLPILLLIRLEAGRWSFRSERPYMSVLRGLLGFTCFTAYYLAVAALPLAVAVTLFFSSPLFVTALAGPVLGERIGWRRWLAVLVGFAGVLAIVRPDGGALDPAMAFGIFAAVTYAVMVLITRRIAKRVSGSTMSLYAMLTFIAASGLLGLLLGDGRFAGGGHPSSEFLLRAWVLPGWRDAGLIAVCGLIAGVGFYCLSQAYRVAAPSTVAPFEYCALPWAVLWGFLFWAEIPRPTTWLGIFLIVAGGLYIVHREGARGRRMVSSRPLRPKI